MPLRDDFGVWLNDTKLIPSKQGKGLIEKWILGKDIKTLPKPPLKDIEVRRNRDSQKPDRRYGLEVPGLGRISGYAEAYKDLLTGKSDEIGLVATDSSCTFLDGSSMSSTVISGDLSRRTPTRHLRAVPIGNQYRWARQGAAIKPRNNPIRSRARNRAKRLAQHIQFRTPLHREARRPRTTRRQTRAQTCRKSCEPFTNTNCGTGACRPSGKCAVTISDHSKTQIHRRAGDLSLSSGWAGQRWRAIRNRTVHRLRRLARIRNCPI